MAEIVSIKVNVTGNGAEQLKSIKKLTDTLNSTPVTIKIETVGDVKALQAEARLEAAKAKRIASENRLKIAQEGTKQSEQAANREKEKTIQIEKQATLEIRRRETAEQKRKTAIKQGETAEKQAALATARATEAEKKRALAIEQGKTAQKQKQLQEEKTRTATENHAAAEAKAAAAADRRATAEAKAAGATRELGTQTEKTAKKAETLWDNFQKFARWYIIGNAFSAIVRSMREALDTMKAVDDELVTIRKVTGFSNEQIAGIRNQAYSTASQYGVGAADYLSSVAAFSRAGYKEQSAALAELSTKTQIVGDTTAEIANQFLISTDAAYKYKGSIQELSKVLDGANELDNKYATSIEKIAEGMGIVAPVAAQMNVSIDELAAAIGTITAVTQRSGSEAARALRALFLNIAGDTKTEIDEGVTWTTGEIAGLREVVKLYAKDAYDAAQATGSIIDPMRAMEGLAKSMQDGLLTEQKLIEMVSDIGGKLRSSQLLAIIQNWDMYQSMLQDYAGAIGSADKEVENALDSWSRKTEQLKNAWTEFISHLIETKQIKGGIDLLTKAVGFLDSGLGRAAVTAGLLFTALKVTGVINGLIALISGLITTIGGLTTATELFNVVWAASPFMVVAVGAAAIYGIVKAVDALNVTYDEHLEKLRETQKEYDALYGDDGEYARLKSRIGELTEEEVKRLGVLESQRDALKEQLELEKRATFAAWRKTAIEWIPDSINGELYAHSRPEVELASAKTALNGIAELMASPYASGEDYVRGIKRIINSIKDSAEAIRDGRDAGADLEEEEEQLLALYERLSKEVGDYTVKTDASAKAAEQADNSVSDLVNDLLSLQDELGGAAAAMEAFNEATKVEKGDALKDYAKVFEEFIKDWEGGLKGSNTVKAAIEAILGPDAIHAAAGDWETLGEMLASDFWRGVFADKGEDYGANFMNALADIADENGNLVNSNNKVIASFKEEGETLTLTGYDLQGLAEYLGTTPDVIMSLVDAWDIWSGRLIISREEIMALAEKLDALTSSGAVDVGKLLSGLVADGRTSTEIWDIYNALSSMEGVTLENVPADIGEIVAQAAKAKDKTDEASEALDDLDSKEAKPKVELDTTRFDISIRTVKNALEQLSKTPTTVSIVTRSAAAGGTDSAVGGETLVNEEGPEIIQEGGTARIAGNGRPTVTDVKPGARIFTAEETRKILAGRSGFGGTIRAAAIGFDGSGMGGGTSGASGPRYNYNQIPDSAPVAVPQESGPSLDDLKNAVALLKQELSFLQESGAASEEIWEKQRDIQAALHAQAEAMRQSEEYQRGDAKAVADVVALSTEWWRIQNDIADAKEKQAEEDRKAAEEARKAKEEEEKAGLEARKSDVSLRKQQLEYAREQGTSDAEIEDIQRAIQDALREEIAYLESIGGSEEEILKLKTEVLSIENDIADAAKKRAEEEAKAAEEARKAEEEARQKELQDREGVVSLRKQELAYLKERGATDAQIIAQNRRIQDALRAQRDYMVSIGASREDVLRIETEILSISNEIVDIEDRIAQKLRDDIADALEEIIGTLEEAEEAMTGPLQEQLDALTQSRDAAEELRREEEKTAAVQQKQIELEKAKLALENARRERTVRQYNAKTGQWEWVADAKSVDAALKSVETAQKNLIDAQTDLADYYADKEYKAAKAAIEKQITNTKSAFDDLKKAMEEAAKAVRDGKMSYQEAYDYIKAEMKKIYDKYGVDLTGTLDKSGGNLQKALNNSVSGLNEAVENIGKVNGKFEELLKRLSPETQTAVIDAASMLDGTEDDLNTGLGLFTKYMQDALQTNDPETAIRELADAIRKGIVTDLNDVGTILDALNGKYANISNSTARLWALTKMQANSIMWHLTEDEGTRAAMHAENVRLGTAMGLSYDAEHGTWHDATGQQVYTLNFSDGQWTSALSGDYSTAGGASAGGTSGSSSGSAGSGGTAVGAEKNYGNTYNPVNVTTDGDGNEIYSAKDMNGKAYIVSPDMDDDAPLPDVAYGYIRALLLSAQQGHSHGSFDDSEGYYGTGLKWSVRQDRDGKYYVFGNYGNYAVRFYDTGGILRGRGGIKATDEDEMVLPPETTRRLLTAEANGNFEALLSHLGIVTAAADRYAGIGGAVSKNTIGEQHNGDVYQLGGVTISEGQAKGMTVYQFAQLAGTLALRKGS